MPYATVLVLLCLTFLLNIVAIFVRAKLPRHPLTESGFLSVGCMPCTSRTTEGEDERAGRWRGRAKTECGIHTMKIP